MSKYVTVSITNTWEKNMPLYLIRGPEKIQWHRTLQSTHCAVVKFVRALSASKSPCTLSARDG